MSADAVQSQLSTTISAAIAPIDMHQRRADIQGLRAIAVLSVVIFHATGDVLPGGFVGVDIFFVISGYLITGILMDEIATSKFSLGAFYERRIRRLFPALFVMLASVMVAGLVLLPPRQMEELGHTGLSTIFFVSNFDLFGMTGYFDSEAQTRPLLHTWSLAVEEQFYLLYPLILLGLMRMARKQLRLILLVGALASLLLCLWALQHNTAAAFYLAPFRGYELMMGAALARLPFPDRAASLRNGLSLAGLVMIVASLFLINGGMAFPGLAALLPCAGTALVLFTGAGATSLGGRLISNPVATFFGGISYSLYLWHWPVLVLGRAALLATPTPLQTLVLIGLAVLLATVSWRWIERPFLRGPGDRTRVLMAGGAAMMLGAVVTGATVMAQGLPARFSPEAQQMFAARDDFNPRRPECHHYLDAVTPYADNCSYGAAGARPDAAMWSDSHGTELVAALGEQAAAPGHAILGITSSACPPAMGYDNRDYPLCLRQNEVTLQGLLHDSRIGTVYLAAYFSGYAQKDWPAIADGLARSVEALTRAGKHVVLVYPIPVFSHDVPTALGMMIAHGEDASTYSITWQDFARTNRKAFALLDSLRARFGADAIHPEQALCREERCLAYDSAAGPLYFNRDHLSLAGARQVLRKAGTPAEHIVAQSMH